MFSTIGVPGLILMLIILAVFVGLGILIIKSLKELIFRLLEQ